jgi:ubiquinone/menaquinone biosynthesis C-methylase UbiE
LIGEERMAIRHDPEGTETRVVHDLIDFRGADVLEVGCGDGRLTWRFCGAARSVLALDPKAKEVAAARREAKRLGYRHVAFKAADVATVGLPAPGFDVAVLSWSI